MTEKDNRRVDSQPITGNESVRHGLASKNVNLVRAAIPLLLAMGCGQPRYPHASFPPSHPNDSAFLPLNIQYPLGCSSKEGLLEVAENHPGEVLSKWSDCKGKPYMDEVIERAAKAGVEKDPEGVIRNFADIIIDKPYAREVLMGAMENAKGSFHSLISEYHINKIVDLSYAEEIFLKLAEEIPSSTMYCIEHFKDKPYASKVFMKIMDDADNEKLKHFYWGIEIAKRIADQPYAEEVMLKFADRIPEFMLPRSEVFADKAYASVIFIRLIDNIKNNDTLESSLKDTIYKIADDPRAEEVFLKLADRIPKFVLQKTEWFFKDKPYAKRIVRRAKEIMNQ